MPARSIALMVLTLALVVVPWTVRNLAVFGKPIIIKSTLGTNLWQGNNPYVEDVGAGIRPIETLARYIPAADVNYLMNLNEAELSEYLGKEALRFIVQNPRTFVSFTVQRAIGFWSIGFRDVSLPGGRLLAGATSAIMTAEIGLAVLGAISSRQRWRDTSLIVLVLAIYPVPYYITISDTYRYRFPLEPLLLLLAAYALVWTYGAVSGMSSKKIVQPSSIHPES